MESVLFALILLEQVQDRPALPGSGHTVRLALGQRGEPFEHGGIVRIQVPLSRCVAADVHLVHGVAADIDVAKPPPPGVMTSAQRGESGMVDSVSCEENHPTPCCACMLSSTIATG